MLTSDIESKLAIVKSNPTYRGSPEKREILEQNHFQTFLPILTNFWDSTSALRVL